MGLGVGLAVMAACGDDDTKGQAQALCAPPPRRVGVGSASVGLEPAFGDAKFSKPIELVFGPGGRAYIVEQAGILRVVPPDGGATSVAIDISDRIVSGGEAGLLGLAFDPRFAENGLLYMYFTAKIEAKDDVVFQDVLARFNSADGGLTIDPASQKILFAVDDPYSNHNGGHIAFGPDGMLYAGLGDGGSGGDPHGNGQNTNVLLGKLLRIDPHGGDPYGSPPTNPFAAGGGRPEIYAYGLRNPWKFSFDTATGDLWLADVGQNKYEEVNRIVLGGNYGWNTREGRHCYQSASCASTGMIDPIAEYTHDEGVSITGGYVYRGKKVPALDGKFIYGDFGSGTIWSVDAQGTVTRLLETNLSISSFGQDSDGEVYVVDMNGSVKRLAQTSGDSPSPSAGTSLSQTNCIDSATPRAPGNAIAYTVSSPLWSDGAEKDRWVFLPPGSKISVRADGDFDLPPGSAAVKTFTVDGKKIETRLFARYADGEWSGFSYEWSDDQKDAVLLEGSKSKDLPNGRRWYFPSRAECLTCHTAAAGFTIGLEARQLDHDDAQGNVLARFAGVLETPIQHGAFASLSAADTQGASNESRARGYLHANCSMCHRPGVGAGAATIDLRIDQDLAGMLACNVAPQAGDLGVSDARIITPGDSAKSTLALRMRARDPNRMPPLATSIVDDVGVASVEAWIRDLAACP